MGQFGAGSGAFGFVTIVFGRTEEPGRDKGVVDSGEMAAAQVA